MRPKPTEEQLARRREQQREYYKRNRAEKIRRVKERNAKLTAEQWTEKSRRYRARSPQKARAQKWVAHRVERNGWPPARIFKCSDCDAQAQSYHHEDYDLPWSVEPLCHRCHGLRHRQEDRRPEHETPNPCR